MARQYNSPLILHGETYLAKEDFARTRNISWRTLNRHREKGLPWLLWGNRVYIPEAGGDEYIAGLVTRRNPPRRNKRQAAGGEINAA